MGDGGGGEREKGKVQSEKCKVKSEKREEREILNSEFWIERTKAVSFAEGLRTLSIEESSIKVLAISELV
jgi:hypothetical protein